MTRHRFLIALATVASLAAPGTALADDDDFGPVLRGVVAPQFHGFLADLGDDNRWVFSHRVSHDDDDDDRWDDDDDDDDDRWDRWDDDDDD